MWTALSLLACAPEGPIPVRQAPGPGASPGEAVEVATDELAQGALLVPEQPSRSLRLVITASPEARFQLRWEWEGGWSELVPVAWDEALGTVRSTVIELPEP